MNGLLPTFGFTGILPATLTSPPLKLIQYNTVQFLLHTLNNITIKFYKTNSIRSINGTLFYETNLSAGQTWEKRFVAPSLGFYYVITSTDATLNHFEINAYGHIDTPHTASVFPNSIVDFNNPANLVMEGNSFHLDLVRDLHTNFKKINIAGAIESVSEVVTDGVIGLDSTLSFEETAAQVYLTNSGTDSTAGTGCHELTIIYNDSSNDRQEMVLVLNSVGTLLVTGLVSSMIERVIVSGTGTSGKNVNEIRLHDITGTITYNRVHAGENISRATQFRVPNDKILVLSNSSISGYSSVPGVVSFVEGLSNSNVAITNQIEREIGRFRIVTGATQYTYDIDGKINSGQFIKAVFKPDVAPPYAAGACDISVTMNGMLCPLPNTY